MEWLRVSPPAPHTAPHACGALPKGHESVSQDSAKKTKFRNRRGAGGGLTHRVGGGGHILPAALVILPPPPTRERMTRGTWAKHKCPEL